MSHLDYAERTSEAVLDYLGRMLPTSEVTRLAHNADERQLLLLKMPQLVAGFGFTSHDLKSTYARLYATFKREYSEHRDEWDEMDLAFVLCVPEDISGLQAFGSSVETDVYFCRKYVVPVNGHVGTSLARLPFLPLFTERSVALRLPSAQTFLQDSGVPAVLARYVVKKGERSARAVLEECVGGTFGELRIPKKSTEGRSHVESTEAVTIRVRSISIEGFRAYRRKTELSFGADLTVLFGPNGFGKTSVFDAIDFAFTGEIGRLRTRSEERFSRVAAHLDSTNGANGVRLTVGINGEAHELVRGVAERKSAQMDGIQLDRKATLQKLTGWRGPGTDRIENMISLFRATHLFSQEHQELARDFQSECRLPSEVVARLLAYEDYHATREKVSEVCDIATKEIRSIDDKIEEHKRLASVESEELESVGRTMQSDSPIEDLSGFVEAIAKRIGGMGIVIDSIEPRTETLRSWRMALETRSSQLRKRSQALTACLGPLEELPRRREELSSNQARLESVKSAVVLATERKNKARASRMEIVTRIEQLEGRLKYLVGRRNTLAWIKENERLHTALRTRVNSSSEQLTSMSRDLDRLVDKEKSLSATLRERETRRVSIAQTLSDTQSKMQGGQIILGEMPAWEKNRERLRNIEKEEKILLKTASEVRRSTDRLHAALRMAVQEEEQLTLKIGEVEANRGELNQLVEALEDHIDSGVCPTCGQDHGSRRQLLERISVQMGRAVATDERASRDTLRAQVKELRSDIREHEGRAKRTTHQLTELAEEREIVAAKVATFSDMLEGFAVLASGDADAARKEVAARYALLERQNRELTADVTRVGEESDSAKREWEATTRSIRQVQGEVNEIQNGLDSASRQLDNLLDDPQNQGDIVLGSPSEVVREQERSTDAESASTQELLSREREALRIAEESLSASEADLTSREAESTALSSEIAKLSQRCFGIEGLLANAGVDHQEDQDAVLHRAQGVAEEASVVDSLIEEVARAELVIDAATTRAAYRRLRSRLIDLRSKISELKSKRNVYNRWLEYFEEILTLVASEQDRAVSIFTNEYGPRTSIIQQRLRSVYGFEDVEICSQESKILVRVSRRGKRLRPTDYFSQSQQQTLLLGLFLTACVSQTWSGLAPVFLDDPVGHFDDLNIFAFLDLIDGMLNDHSAGKRQFIVSTCDRTFFELAREKFAYRGDTVKYYSFHGIGEEGPIIKVN